MLKEKVEILVLLVKKFFYHFFLSRIVRFTRKKVEEKMKKHPITVASGDGIGPEIMETTLFILKEAGALLDIEKVEMGEKLFLSGHMTGIEEKAWESIRRTKVFLKAPMTTPQGGGYKSLNVTVRARLGLYANIRPSVSYAPFISTKHPQMDVVIVRENEEDLYTGIEYRPTSDVTLATKLISRLGSEKIVRYAFEYALSYGRKKVTCFTKDNILKMTDGLFHQIFEEIGQEYPQLEKEHWIVDIGAAKLADTPEAFDVVVLPNLYGDILSDVAGQISGSVGLSGSANIGEHAAMFEAVHGSAPKRAGQNVANPTGLLLGAIMMLVHIHQKDVASTVHNALLKTLEEGIHTYDIFREGVSKKTVGTKEFGQEIVKRLGQKPHTLKSVSYETKEKREIAAHKGLTPSKAKRDLVGVDIYIHSYDSVEKLQTKLHACAIPSLKLTKITNRGIEVWPVLFPETSCIDLWRCRFEGNNVSIQAIASLVHRLADNHLDVTKTEHLYTYEGKAGYSS